jgi:Uma2 family endonuclease
MQTTTARWQDLLNDPVLQDLPYKVETNEHGQIVLSPHTRIHSRLESKISALVETQGASEGVSFVELAIDTAKGTKVPDVAWMRTERYKSIPDSAEPTPIAPDLCVEVASPSNLEAVLAEKRALYFDAGAQEVWVVSTEGDVRFFDVEGTRNDSLLFPEAPTSFDA